MSAAASAAATSAASKSHPYLLSKIADPLFALFIGTSAAFVRIRRERKENFPEEPSDMFTIWGVARGRVGRWWRGEIGR